MIRMTFYLFLVPLLISCTSNVAEDSKVALNGQISFSSTDAFSAQINSDIQNLPNSPASILSKLMLRKAWIVDDHSLDPVYTANGNCNGQADAGETIQLIYDILNTGTISVGPAHFILKLLTPTTYIELPTMMAAGGWQIIYPGKTLIESMGVLNTRPDVLFTDAHNMSVYFGFSYLYGMTGIVIKKGAPPGIYQFVLSANLLDTKGRSIQSVAFPFSLKIGNVPSNNGCGRTFVYP